MSVPAHDQRDFEFANQYKLPILQVLTPSNGQSFDLAKSAYTGTGTLINSEGFNGLDIETAKQTILEQLISVKKADSQVNYRLARLGNFQATLLGRRLSPLFTVTNVVTSQFLKQTYQ